MSAPPLIPEPTVIPDAAGAPAPAAADAPIGRAAVRAAMLAEMRAAKRQPKNDAAPAPEEVPDALPDDAPEGDGAGEEDVAEPTDVDDEPEGEPDDEPPLDDGEEDPVLAKRLAQIKREETRARDALRAQADEAKAEITAKRAELEREYRPRIEAAEKYEQVAKTAKRDPAAVLMSLGLDNADLAAAAKQIFLMSQGDAADPRLRAQAAEALRAREQESKLDATARELAELKEEKKREREQAEHQRNAETYMGTVTNAVTDAYPLLTAQLKTAPERAHNALAALAVEIHQDSGEVPEPADLIAEYEKRRAADLAELGIDVSALKKKPVAEKKQATTTLTAKARQTPTPPRTAPLTREELKAQTVKELRAMKTAG